MHCSNIGLRLCAHVRPAFAFEEWKKMAATRMHSSRMRTARSSGHPGGVATRHPPLEQASPRSRHPPGAGTPVDRHMPVNILPCPKLRLRAVISGVHT